MTDYLEAARRASGTSEARILGEGQLAVAVLVGKDRVLRFPRHEFGIDRLRYEVRLLDEIRPALGSCVPHVTDVRLDASVGEAYVEHVLVPGVVLRQGDATVASVVASQLRTLHALVDEGHRAGAPTITPLTFAEALRTEVRELLADRMRPAVRERADRALDALAQLNTPGPMALCHTDIGGNIVVDSATGSIGFIDFGSAFITDPVFDAASLSCLGEAFLEACGATYPALTAEPAAIRAVRGTFALQDALYGARQQDWTHVDTVLAWYEATA